jgi:hypothetical protein
MKERIVVRTVRREFFIILLFSSMAFVCFSNKANAQGWTFTPQIKLTGNCVGAGAAVAQANAILATIGNMAMPSKSQCESLRQQILSIQVGGGECVVGYTCTPCAGSDLPSSGQIGTPGQINSNAALQGKSFFSAHESSAFEDWATEYKQLLASYGITSILGKNITPRELPKTPMTENPALNEIYAESAAKFNPAQDANVVDLSQSSMIVPLTHTAEDGIALEKWMNDNSVELKNFLSQKNPELTQTDLEDIIECIKDIVKYEIDNLENFQVPDIDWGLVNEKYDKKSLIQLGVDFLVDEKGKRLEVIDKTITQGIDDVLTNKASIKTTDEIISTVDELLKTKTGLLTVSALKWGSNAVSLYGLKEDIGTVINDFKTDQDWSKRFYDASVTVADAGLLIGSVAAAAGVTAGALTVSTPVAVGATVAIVGAKLYVEYGSAKK